jgi:hypothetical protein
VKSSTFIYAASRIPSIAGAVTVAVVFVRLSAAKTAGIFMLVIAIKKHKTIQIILFVIVVYPFHINHFVTFTENQI